jgi:hypothetical protein
LRRYESLEAPNRPVRSRRFATFLEGDSSDSVCQTACYRWSKWWAMTGSNRRPRRCKRRALPAELIAREDRTSNTRFRSIPRLQRLTYLRPRQRNAGCPINGQPASDLPAGRERLVNGDLQTLASLELRLVRRWNLNALPGPRVAPLRGCAPGDTEGTESDQTHFLTTGQGTGDRIEYAVNGFAGIGFGKTGAARNCRDKIILVQFRAPLCT